MWTDPTLGQVRDAKKYQNAARAAEGSECSWMVRVLGAVRTGGPGLSAVLNVAEDATDFELLTALARYKDKRLLLQRAGLDLTTSLQAAAHLDVLQRGSSPAARGPPKNERRDEVLRIALPWLLVLAAAMCLAAGLVVAAYDLLSPIYLYVGAAVLSALGLARAMVNLYRYYLQRRRVRNLADQADEDRKSRPSVECTLAFSRGPSVRRPSTFPGTDFEQEVDAELGATTAGSPTSGSGSPRRSELAPEVTPRALDNNQSSASQCTSMAQSPIRTSIAQSPMSATSRRSAVSTRSSFMSATSDVIQDDQDSDPPTASTSFPAKSIHFESASRVGQEVARVDLETALWHSPDEYGFAARFASQAVHQMAEDAKSEAKRNGMMYVADRNSAGSTVKFLEQLACHTTACTQDVVGDLRPHMVQFYNNTVFESENERNNKYARWHPGHERCIREKDEMHRIATNPKKKAQMYKRPFETKPPFVRPPPPPGSAPPMLPVGSNVNDRQLSLVEARDEMLKQGAMGRFIEHTCEAGLVGLIHPEDLSPLPCMMPPAEGADWPRPVGFDPSPPDLQ